MASLLQLVPPSQVLFGTDFPPGGTSLDVAKTIAGLGLFERGRPASHRSGERGIAATPVTLTRDSAVAAVYRRSTGRVALRVLGRCTRRAAE